MATKKSSVKPDPRMTQLEQALAAVCAIVEAIPEHERVRLGLYSMPAFNKAYELLGSATCRARR